MGRTKDTKNISLEEHQKAQRLYMRYYYHTNIEKRKLYQREYYKRMSEDPAYRQYRNDYNVQYQQKYREKYKKQKELESGNLTIKTGKFLVEF